MPEYTQRFSESWEVIDYYLGAAVAAATEVNTGYNVCGLYNRIVVRIHPVALNDALDVDCEQATTAAGAGAKTLDAGAKDVTIATTDTLPTEIEIRPEEFDVTGLFDCLNIEITTANTQGGTNYFVVEILGSPRYMPAATTYVQEVNDG